MAALTEALSYEKNTHLRDVSFSSYLNRSEEAFIRKLAESSKIPESTITIQQDNVYIGTKKVEDGEIGIFGAEKYFNGGIDEENYDHQHVKKQPVNLSPVKVKAQARTPSVQSQSSWNSQSALLQSVKKNSIHSKNAKRRQGRSLFSTLGCNCGDENSIDIDENNGESNSKRNSTREEAELARMNKSRINPRIMEEIQCKKTGELGIGLKREDCFSFPIVNPKPENLATKVHFQEDEDNKERKSLEVFGSPILEKKKNSTSLERKLTMFTLDSNPITEETDFPPSSDRIFDDFDSDASSDLFEIESFSTTNNSNPFLLRQASNTSGCVTPTTCYAPSEASIEWSVVTASAADFSMVSDLEYQKSTTGLENNRKMVPNGKGKEAEKRRSGILSGCKSQKAVRVAGDAYTTNGKAVSDARRQHDSESFAMARIQGKNQISGFHLKNGQNVFH